MAPACEQRVAATTLVVVSLAVFAPGVVASLAGPGHAPVAWGDRVAALEWDVLTVLAVLVAVRFLRRHAPSVRLGLDRTSSRVPGGTAGGAAVFVAAAVASVSIGTAVAGALHLPVRANEQIGTGAGGFVTGVGAGLSAAVTEEILLVALASAVLARTRLTTTVAVLVGLRLAVHAYYLGDSLFVLLWVPAAYAVFRWAGSVWPLVVGHACYDVLAVAAHAWSAPAAGRLLAAVAAVAAAGAAVAVVAAAQRLPRAVASG